MLLLLVVIGTLVPSDGSHALYNPKSIAFILLAGAFFANVIQKRRFTPKDQGLLIASLLIGSWIAFFSVVGLENGTSCLGQLKLFIITAMVPISALYLIESKQLTFSSFARTVIFANLFYSLVKIGLVLLHLAGVINLLKVMQMLGLRFMSMEVLGSLGRMQTSVDILTPFLLYFVLSAEKWGIALSKGFVRFYLPITWLSIALSFSRFFIACGLIAHLMVWITKKEIPLVASILKCSLVAFLLVAAAGPERVYKVVEKRFLSEENSRSDAIRADQIEAMWSEFEDAPLLGKGMGGYTEKGLRDKELKFSYEVQWMAFLMQFGLIGLFLILLFLAYLAYLIIRPPLTLDRLGLFGLFLLWIAAGLTNPFLVSLPSGILYTFFLVPNFKNS
jgi:hypothetical protein